MTTKNKFFYISILIAILLLAAGFSFKVSLNKGTVSPQVHNQNIKSIDSKTNMKDSTNIKSDLSLTDDDFVINEKNHHFELAGQFSDLKTNEKIIKTVPANESHIYDVYQFKNFKLITQPSGRSGSIIGIDLTTSIIQTSRGIRVGDGISDVIEKYGDPDDHSLADSIAPGQYIYQYNGKFLTFFINKAKKVVLIGFELV
jgi:hypothetical protein